MRALVLTGVAVVFSASFAASAQQPPAAPPAPACVASDATFVCGQRAPEDLVVVPREQRVVASAYSQPGGLYLVRTSDRTSTMVYPVSGAKERLDAKTYNTFPAAPDARPEARFQTHGRYLLAGTNSVHRL